MKHPFVLSAVLAALTLGTGSAFADEASSTSWNETGPLTRAQVREALRTARAAGTMLLPGEIGDNSDAVLTARENFNAAQAEVMIAAYQREAERVAALEQASRDEAEQQALAAETGDFAAVMAMDTAGAPGDADSEGTAAVFPSE